MKNKTYDQIIGIGLNTENINDTWVAFMSKEFFFVQFMKIDELIQEQRKIEEEIFKLFDAPNTKYRAQVNDMCLK